MRLLLALLALTTTMASFAQETLHYVLMDAEGGGSNIGRLAFRVEVPAAFPNPSRLINVDFDCQQGVIVESFWQDEWARFVRTIQPEITEDYLRFDGYTLACSPDDKWTYLEAPDLESLLDLIDGATIESEKRSWGVVAGNPWNLPTPSLAVNVRPYLEDGRHDWGAGVLVLPLEAPLTPKTYTLFRSGRGAQSPPEDTIEWTAIVTARQNGPLAPVLFEEQLHNFEFDPSRTFEIHAYWWPMLYWEHFLINLEVPAIMYRADRSEPATDAEETFELARFRARLLGEPYLRSITVQEGESLFQIARENGTTVKEIQRINCLETPIVTPGTELKVPDAPQVDYQPTCG